MFASPSVWARRNRGHEYRRGAILVLSAFMMVVVFGFVAFSIDIGYICFEKGRCQNAADAASHAAVCNLLESRRDLDAAMAESLRYAALNIPEGGNVLLPSDVVFGNWDPITRTFTPGPGVAPNAVRVVVRRAQSNGNPLPLFFAPVIGHTQADTGAEAITMFPAGTQFRFLIDDEMIDNDHAGIIELADSLGELPDDIISDKNGDGWLDLPPTTIELPTGQVGDEGLFDRKTHEEAFPFKEDTTYSMLDFLAEGTALQDILGTQHLQDAEWGASNAPHPDFIGNKVLDPVPGIQPMDDHQEILDLPDPDRIYVSPVFKSDANMTETDSSKYGSPTANLLTERRGLLAFKIISARVNPDGGSYLPLLTIEVIDHNTIDFEQVAIWESGTLNPVPVIVK